MTADDTAEVAATLAALEQAEQAVRDLADRRRRMGDHDRARQLRVRAAWDVEKARESVAAMFA